MIETAYLARSASLVLDKTERLNGKLLLDNIQKLALLVLALEHLVGDKGSSGNLLLVVKAFVVIGALSGALSRVGSGLGGVALHKALPLWIQEDRLANGDDNNVGEKKTLTRETSTSTTS